jgi:hypothetical protein
MFVSILPLRATVIHVPGDVITIRHGILLAEDGDTVMVAPGIYHEHNISFLGKAITVTGTDPADSAVVASTVIDGDSSGRVFLFYSGEDSASILTGLTITGGYIRFDLGGAGIWCSDASPTITRNIISGNHASDGGGIDCDLYASPLIADNIITGNSADEGGGGIRSYIYSSPRIVRNVIRGNTAGIGGGGIRCFNSSPEIASNIFSENSAYWGGAIYCFNEGVPPFPTITNNLLHDNSAHSGGGIYCNYTSPVILNNSITGNSATFGGGITSYQSASPIVTNSILWDNDAPTGPEIYVGDLDNPSMMTVNYSDVEGGESSVYVELGSTLNWGAGIIDADPLFTLFRRFDYLLNRGSPCIDAGDPALEDGFDWPQWYSNGSRSDMGAYGGPGNVGWLPGSG